MIRPILLKAIAVQEFLGGLSGPFLGVGLLIGWVQTGVTVEQLVAFGIAVTIYLLAIFAGVMLWRDRRVGYVTSAIVQFVQLIKIAAPQFAFLFGFGVDLSVVSATHPGAGGRPVRALVYATHIGPQSGIEFSRPPGATQVFGVSIIACISLTVLRTGRQPVASPDLLPSDTSTTQTRDVRGDGQPNWVLPFWFKLVICLFVFLMVLIASCAGLALLPQ